MSYAIIRNANYKKDNLVGIYKHNERKNTNYSNKDINKTNSINNYSIKQCNTTYNNAIKILQQENNLKGRIMYRNYCWLVSKKISLFTSTFILTNQL